MKTLIIFLRTLPEQARDKLLAGPDHDEGRVMFDSLYGLITDYPDRYPGKFALAGTPDEVTNNFRNGLFSLPLCLENGAPVGNDLSYIRQLKEKGIAYITLCHSKSNQICDSNYDSNRPWNGLSPFGIEVIREMNRQGIMIDISHSTDSVVFQALRISKAPIVATHSSCRYFPGQLLAKAEQVADHIDHVVKIAGIDYVGLGSDFDGIGPSQPIGLPDVSGYPVLVTELLKRGYSEKEIEKILARNFLRVWNEVLK